MVHDRHHLNRRSHVIAAALLMAAPLTNLAAQEILGEITVSARKVEENLLDAPLSITALTAVNLEERGIVDFKDVVGFTPGFYFSDHNAGRADRGSTMLMMRGMAVTTETESEQGASVFVDGAPILGGQLVGLDDAASIEVVRGPQSAYFGRGTFAGAVNYVTKTPGHEFAGRMTADVGNYGSSNFSLQFEGPLMGDALRGRVSASQYTKGGQYKTANSAITLGDRETTAIATQLYFEPNERFTAKLRVAGWRDKDGPSASFSYGLGNGAEYFNCRPPGSTLPNINGTNNWLCGKIPVPKSSQVQGDYTVTADVRQLLANIPDAGQRLDYIFGSSMLDNFGLEREAIQSGLSMDYEFDGGYTLTSISAYQASDWQALDDFDHRATLDLGNQFDSVMLGSREISSWSQEIRLASPREQRLRWLVGGSFFELEGTRTSGFKVSGLVRSTSVGDIYETSTTGIFGSVEFDISDRWTASVEGRRQWDDVARRNVDGSGALSGTFKSFTPRVIVDFKPNDDITLYMSYAEGTRPGSFNTGLIGLPQSTIDQLRQDIGYASLEVPEEELENYEIGFKGRLWDGRAHVQSAIYVADWLTQTSANRTITLPSGTTTAVLVTGLGGDVRLYGIEVEGALAVTDSLKLEAAFSYNENDIGERNCSNCAFLAGRTELINEGVLERVPVTKGSLSGTYTFAVNAALDAYARVDYLYQGTQYIDALELTDTGASHKVNLRLGANTGDLRIEGYVRNLFDDLVVASVQLNNDLSRFGTAYRQLSGGLPDRRTFGVRFVYDF